MVIHSTRLLSVALLLLSSSLVTFGCGDTIASDLSPDDDVDGGTVDANRSDTGSAPVGDAGAGADADTGAGADADTDTDAGSAPCAANQRVSAHACVACDAGSTRAAGDDPKGPDTQCEATLCAVDEHVVSHTCVTCDAGSWNVAGDDASGADTACDGLLCPSNQHVVSHACVPCPAGTTRAAGDDASGADTSCEAKLCAADEHVASHACVPCPANSVNAADDDASGDDTSCDLVETDVCASVPENEPLTLQCFGGAVINGVTFASYGLPNGTCGTFSAEPSCDASTSVAVMTAACKGKTSCTVSADNVTFGDPCFGIEKVLSVQAQCGLCGNGVNDGAEVCDDGVNDGLFCDSTCSTQPIVGRIRLHCQENATVTDEIRGSDCVNITTNGASWLSMAAGARATVYDAADCTGKQKVISETETSFCNANYDEGGSLNDTVRSIRIERNN